MKSYIEVRYPVYRILSQSGEFRGPHIKVTRAQIGQTCNELGSVQQQKKTRQTKEHLVLYFQGGPQEYEFVTRFCADHCTGTNYMEDSCCPMCTEAHEDQSLSKINVVLTMICKCSFSCIQGTPTIILWPFQGQK